MSRQVHVRYRFEKDYLLITAPVLQEEKVSLSGGPPAVPAATQFVDDQETDIVPGLLVPGSRIAKADDNRPVHWSSVLLPFLLLSSG